MNPTFRIELGSHTDARGKAEYNMSLSEKRAKAAMDYLIKQGVDPNRLTFKGYGEEYLINKCGEGVECSDEEHEQNRRTVFTVLEM